MAEVKLYDGSDVEVFRDVENLAINRPMLIDLYDERGALTRMFCEESVVIPCTAPYVNIEVVRRDYFKVFFSLVPGVERIGNELHFREASAWQKQ